MTPDELSERIGQIVAEAQSRITGIGAQQYHTNDGQKFERMTMQALLEYSREEMLDLINYAAMNVIRFDWMREALARGVDDAVREYEGRRTQDKTSFNDPISASLELDVSREYVKRNRLRLEYGNPELTPDQRKELDDQIDLIDGRIDDMRGWIALIRGENVTPTEGGTT